MTSQSTIKDRLDADLKAAMLGGDKQRTEIIRGLKSVILYAEVANGSRETGGLDDTAVTALLAKESKKRQESADLYMQGGAADKADKELVEKSVIDSYLPAKLSDEELDQLVDATMAEFAEDEGRAATPGDMGKLIGAVKSKAGASADGAAIAKAVQAKLRPAGGAQ